MFSYPIFWMKRNNYKFQDYITNGNFWIVNQYNVSVIYVTKILTNNKRFQKWAVENLFLTQVKKTFALWGRATGIWAAKGAQNLWLFFTVNFIIFILTIFAIPLLINLFNFIKLAIKYLKFCKRRSSRRG